MNQSFRHGWQLKTICVSDAIYARTDLFTIPNIIFSRECLHVCLAHCAAQFLFFFHFYTELDKKQKRIVCGHAIYSFYFESEIMFFFSFINMCMTIWLAYHELYIPCLLNWS